MEQGHYHRHHLKIDKKAKHTSLGSMLENYSFVFDYCTDTGGEN